MKKLFSLILGISLSVTAIAAEPVVVIVNAKNAQRLSVEDIRNIYMDNIIAWNNNRGIQAYDLPLKDAARRVFSEEVLSMSAEAAAMRWANKKITNTAKNPPVTKKAILVASLVAQNPDAIGYVPASVAAGRSGVRVVLTIE